MSGACYITVGIGSSGVGSSVGSGVGSSGGAATVGTGWPWSETPSTTEAMTIVDTNTTNWSTPTGNHADTDN